MFGKSKKKHITPLKFDPEKMKPVIRCSICTGEQSAGLRDLATGRVEEVMMIRNEEDLKEFQAMVGTDQIEKYY